jgi:hypothetical protein
MEGTGENLSGEVNQFGRLSAPPLDHLFKSHTTGATMSPSDRQGKLHKDNIKYFINYRKIFLPISRVSFLISSR